MRMKNILTCMRTFLMNKVPGFCGFEVVDDLRKVVCKYPHNHISSSRLTMTDIIYM